MSIEHNVNYEILYNADWIRVLADLGFSHERIRK